MALGNEKISISENIVKVVGAKEFKVRRVKKCKLFNPCNLNNFWCGSDYGFQLI